VSLALLTMRLATHPNLACMVIQLRWGDHQHFETTRRLIRVEAIRAAGLDISLLPTPPIVEAEEPTPPTTLGPL
jgi:hypothetical protein